MSWLVKKPEFYKTLLMLAIPMALQNLLSMSVGFADNIMVGQLGERAVAGVLIANQVQSILNMLVIGISASLVILAAQYWGKRDMDSVKAVAAIGIKVGLAVGLLVSVVVLAFPAQVLRIFTNDYGVIVEGVRYIRILAFSYVFFCLTQTLMGAMRCVEVVRIGVVVSFSTLIISVVGNYLLIFGHFGFPQLGIQGAAVATLTARVMEAVIMVVYVRFIDKRLQIRFRQLLQTNRQLLADFFRYGLPVMGGDVSWGMIGALKIAIMGRMGEQAMAANSIAAILFGLITVVVWSTSGASGVVIGKTVGSGDYDLVKQYAKTMQLIFACLGVTAGILLFSLRGPFISFYNFAEETQVMARQFMTILSVSVMFTAYHAPCFTGIIRAGGDTKFVFIVDSICSWCFVLPMAFLAAFVFNAPPWVVFLCIFSDQFYKWIIAAVKTNRFKWIRNLTREAKVV
ncbi:MAG: MATE family efflux transporter [Defluviitaleaceae bacterium]|nr:MATE family efflux transporter [Defluviitaleaceae bacterium]